MGNVAVTVEAYDVFGAARANRIAVTFSGAYATGGDVITAKQCGMSTLRQILWEETLANEVEFDRANLKVKLANAAGTEATNGTDQSAVTVRGRALGAF